LGQPVVDDAANCRHIYERTWIFVVLFNILLCVFLATQKKGVTCFTSVEYRPAI